MRWVLVVGVLASAVAGVPVGSNPRSLAVKGVDQQQQLGEEVDAYQLFPQQFANEFKAKFLAEVNKQKRKGSDGNALNFVDAEIVGFPTTPIPTEGEVSWETLTQTGGIKLQEYEPVRFEAEKSTFVPQEVVSSLHVNSGKTELTEKVEYIKSFTSSQTLTFSTYTEAKSETGFSFGIPFFAQGGMEKKIETTTTNSEAKTSSETKTWETLETLRMAPNTVTNASCFIASGTVDTTWSASFVPMDSVAIGWVYYDDRERPKGTGFWFEQQDQSWAGLKGWAKTLRLNDFALLVRIGGSFSGTSADHVQCDIHACPYRPDTQRCVG